MRFTVDLRSLGLDFESWSVLVGGKIFGSNDDSRSSSEPGPPSDVNQEDGVLPAPPLSPGLVVTDRVKSLSCPTEVRVRIEEANDGPPLSTPSLKTTELVPVFRAVSVST